MYKKIAFIASTFLSSVLADDCCDKGWFGSVGLGTTGVSAEIGYTLNPTFKTRVNASGAYHFKRNLSIGQYEMEHVQIRLGMVRFLMDWHLFKNGLRLTGGFGFNGNHIKLRKNLAGMQIHGITIPNGVGFAHVKYHYKKFNTYAGIGFDTGCIGKKGVSLAFDLGCVFTGKPKPKVQLPALVSTLLPGAHGYATHYFRKLGHDHKWLHYYPVATVSLRYQF